MLRKGRYESKPTFIVVLRINAVNGFHRVLAVLHKHVTFVTALHKVTHFVANLDKRLDHLIRCFVVTRIMRGEVDLARKKDSVRVSVTSRLGESFLTSFSHGSSGIAEITLSLNLVKWSLRLEHKLGTADFYKILFVSTPTRRSCRNVVLK